MLNSWMPANNVYIDVTSGTVTEAIGEVRPFFMPLLNSLHEEFLMLSIDTKQADGKVEIIIPFCFYRIGVFAGIAINIGSSKDQKTNTGNSNGTDLIFKTFIPQSCAHTEE